MTVTVQSGQLTCMLEADDIARLLPHRYPFFLLDRVVNVRAGGERRGDQERQRRPIPCWPATSPAG